MGKIKLLATLCVIICLLPSCGARKGARLDYSDGAYYCEFIIECGDLKTAFILNAETKDSEGNRDFVLSFGGGERLSDVIIEVKDGVGRLRYEELTLECAAEDHYKSVVALFECDGKVIASEPIKEDGKTLDMITLESDEGKRRTVYLDPESSLPSRIIGEIDSKRVDISVSAFEKR